MLWNTFCGSNLTSSCCRKCCSRSASSLADRLDTLCVKCNKPSVRKVHDRMVKSRKRRGKMRLGTIEEGTHCNNQWRCVITPQISEPVFCARLIFECERSLRLP